MSHGRAIDPESPCAYRVVAESFSGVKWYYGPYSTMRAAKAKRTNLIHLAKYGQQESMTYWIEKTPEGWEKVAE